MRPRFLVLDPSRECEVCHGHLSPWSHCPACLGTHCTLIALEDALEVLEAERQEREDERNRQYGLPPGSVLLSSPLPVREAAKEQASNE